MKKLLLVSVLGLLIACGVGEPVGDKSAVETNTETEAADLDELESEKAPELPPEGSLLLSEIIASIEIEGHIFITEVEFEDGVWEVEYVVGDEVYELHIDPMTGDSLSDEAESLDDD